MARDKYEDAARSLAEGGWSSLYDLVTSLPDDVFNDFFGDDWDNEDGEEEEGNDD